MARAALPLLTVALAAAALPAAAQQKVALQGLLGNRALLIVDGSAPRAVAPGDSHQGVRVVSTGDDQAVLEFGGRRHVLRVGEAPASVGAAPAPAGGQRVVLTAGTGGHFMPEGRVNGKPVVFMLDTGATSVSLGAPQAERLGIDFRSGPQVSLQTANGVATGWRVRLASVQVGDVVLHDIDAIVTPASMSFVLLGNSVLSRFRMQREGAQMVLERRY
jgi:aspartyl protease family protein